MSSNPMRGDPMRNDPNRGDSTRGDPTRGDPTPGGRGPGGRGPGGAGSAAWLAAVAGAAERCSLVARLSPRVPVRLLGPGLVEVGVVGRFGAAVPDIAAQVRTAVIAAEPDLGGVDVRVDDLDLTEPTGPVPPPGGQTTGQTTGQWTERDERAGQAARSDDGKVKKKTKKSKRANKARQQAAGASAGARGRPGAGPS